MPLLLLLIFIIVPLTEIALLIKVGEMIGVGATIAIILVTALIGTALLRAEGFAVLNRTTEALAAGRLPVDSVIDGACLLIAGAFLLTPGMLTDMIGFLLFVRPLRRWLAKWILHRMLRSAEVNISVFGIDMNGDDGPGAERGGSSDGKGPIIDGDYTRLDENASSPGQKPRGEKG